MDNKTIPRADGLKQFTYEHAVPLKTLAVALRAASQSDEELELFLDQHILGVVILREEDERLVEKGLRQAMPLDAMPHDRLVRYREAGIAFEPEDLAKLREGWSIHGISFPDHPTGGELIRRLSRRRDCATEPHRVCRRLQLLSRMEHDQQDDEQVFS